MLYRINVWLVACFSVVYTGVFAQDNFFSRLADSALTLTIWKVVYDPSYFY